MNVMYLLTITKVGVASDSFRELLFSICMGILSMVQWAFDLFFGITRWQLLGKESTYIFNRIFLVIGLIMFFKLAMSLITYMVNPESITDKEKGFGKLIGRIVVMLILLYLLMPQPNFNMWTTSVGDDGRDLKTNTETEEERCDRLLATTNITDASDAAAKKLCSARNKDSSYQYNGLLFGLLYDVQDRIIEENVLGKIVFGKSLSNNITVTFGDVLAFQIFNSFFVLNDGEETDSSGVVVSCAKSAEHYLGAKDSDGNYEKYPVSIPDLQYVLTKTCDQDGNKDDYYLFEFNGFTGILTCLGVVILIFLFTFDVALRVIKLGILRLLSPIAAISYIDPKSSKDGTFASYVKTTTSTYLDLFLRLIIVYLGVYLIGSVLNSSSFLSLTNGSSQFGKVIIIISLLYFMGQAPKFIMQALGIKSKGTGLGFGAALIGGALSGGIAGAATGGVWGAIKGTFGGANAGATNQWKAQNGEHRQGSASQDARARGAELGQGQVDPAKSGVFGLIGGQIATHFAHARDGDINTTKTAMYGHKNLADKQAELIKDFRHGVIPPTDANLTDNQKSALRDAGVKYDSEYGTFIDATTNVVLTRNQIIDKLENRQVNNMTEYNKLSTSVEEATKYQKMKIPRANNPDIGARNNLRRQANEIGESNEQMNYEEFDDNNHDIF